MNPDARSSESDAWKRRVAALLAESNKAYLIALRATGTPALAEEAVQEAYARLLEHPLKDEGHDKAVAYLFKMVRSRAIDLSRSTQNRKRREDEYAVRRDEAISSPDEQSEASEVSRAARSALIELPLEEREAVSLCCEQDMSRKAASELLEIPETTLTSRVQRGLEKLRLRLAAQGFAALTPVVIGEGLRELGVPPAPSGLMRAVSDLAKGTAPKNAPRAAKIVKAKSAAGGNSGPAFVTAVVLAGAVAAAVLLTQKKELPVTPKVPPPPPAAVVPVATPAPTPAPTPKMSDGLVGCWKFDEGRGTVAKDYSGNGNNGTLVNGPAWSTGKAGGALSFNGDNTRVDIPNSAALDISGPITIALWENLSEKAAGETDHVLIGKAWTTDNFDPPHWQYAAEYSNRRKTFDFLFSDKSGIFHEPYSFPAVLGTWSHVAFTYDGTRVKGYLNGVEKISIPETRSIQARGNGLRIGIDEVLRQQCKGQLGEIRIYNRALSPAEIAALADMSVKP